MKVSSYNLFFPLKGKYIAYNTLTDSILIVDEDLKTCLETSNTDKIDPEMKKSLLECGFLTQNDTDEKAILRYQYQVTKYSSEYINVLLLPTYACNLSCHYCPNPGEPVFMNQERAQSVVRFLTALMRSLNRGVILKLYGGEPLLNAECCYTLCKTLKSLCERHNLPFLAAAMTNGTLLTHRKTEPLLDFLGAVHVTLEGFRPYHDSIRYYSDGGGTYEDVLGGLRLAREKDMRISARVNTTYENIGSIKDLLVDLKKYKFDEYNKFEIYFGPIAPKEECKHFKDDISSQQFRSNTLGLMQKVREIIKECEWKGKTRDLISDLRSISKPELCQYQKAHSFVIDPRGIMYMCPAFAGDPDYCTGTLSREGTPEFTPLYYDIHTRDVMQSDCADCAYMPVCGGGCPAAAYSQNKSVHSFYCGSVKESTESQMLSYLQYKHSLLRR